MDDVTAVTKTVVEGIGLYYPDSTSKTIGFLSLDFLHQLPSAILSL